MPPLRLRSGVVEAEVEAGADGVEAVVKDASVLERAAAVEDEEDEEEAETAELLVFRPSSL